MTHIEQLILEFKNPYKGNADDTLVINRPTYDFNQWMGISRVHYDEKPYDIIMSLSKDLNCCKYYKDKPWRRPTDIIYKIILADIFYYMLKLNNDLVYNHILDTLCTIHELNLNFIYEYDLEHKPVEKPKRTRKKGKSRAATIDMFTGEKHIVEVDNETGKVSKPKPKFANVGSIPLSSMTFNFKKK